MSSFSDAATAYPTLVYSVLLGVVLVYWVLALIGVVDFDDGGFEVDGDLHADAHADDLGDLASYLVALGLNGVPFSLVVSLLVLISWTVSCLAGMWLLPLVPTQLLTVVVGTGVLVVSLLLALPLTARLIRPLRGLFVTHNALSNQALVGQLCKVVTGSVDGEFGRAEVSTRGTSVNIAVWADTPNALVRGASARIIEYDTARDRYLIVAED
jgi:hypothetical protein